MTMLRTLPVSDARRQEEREFQRLHKEGVIHDIICQIQALPAEFAGQERGVDIEVNGKVFTLQRMYLKRTHVVTYGGYAVQLLLESLRSTETLPPTSDADVNIEFYAFVDDEPFYEAAADLDTSDKLATFLNEHLQCAPKITSADLTSDDPRSLLQVTRAFLFKCLHATLASLELPPFLKLQIKPPLYNDDPFHVYITSSRTNEHVIEVLIGAFNLQLSHPPPYTKPFVTCDQVHVPTMFKLCREQGMAIQVKSRHKNIPTRLENVDTDTPMSVLLKIKNHIARLKAMIEVAQRYLNGEISTPQDGAVMTRYELNVIRTRYPYAAADAALRNLGWKLRLRRLRL